MTDREQVIAEVTEKFPGFQGLEKHFKNHHALREIMLGGSPPWKGLHERFHAYHGAQVMDIGANEGVFALYSAFRGAKETWAYEPAAWLFRELTEWMFSLKPAGALIPVNAAIWKEVGALPFLSHATQDPDALRSNGSLESEGIRWTDVERLSTPKVFCKTLADAVGDVEWDIVKMDIEGAEAEVILSTAPETFEKIKFMFVEFHPWVSLDTYDKMLEQLRMSFRIEPAWIAGTGRMESAYLWRK